MEAIKQAKTLKARRYRNRRLGDFLKELDLSEGRATGIPTIQDKLRKNGSAPAHIETDDARSYFLLEIPCREGFETKISEKSSEKSSEKILILMKSNPAISAKEIAKELNMTSRSVEKNIKTLRDKGILRRVGPDKGGHWEVLI